MIWKLLWDRRQVAYYYVDSETGFLPSGESDWLSLQAFRRLTGLGCMVRSRLRGPSGHYNTGRVTEVTEEGIRLDHDLPLIPLDQFWKDWAWAEDFPK